jgi:hypothetical protein
MRARAGSTASAGELAFGGFPAQVGADAVGGLSRGRLFEVAEEDVEAGAGEDVGDAAAHGARADDCDGLDFGHSAILQSEVARS